MIRNTLAWLGALLLLWFMATLTTRLLLIDQSLTEQTQWSQGQTPWTWPLKRSTDVIEPAFSGIGSFIHHKKEQEHHISFVMTQQNADVSLNLRGRKLDPCLGSAFSVAIQTTQPIQLWLISATAESQPAHELTQTVTTLGDNTMHQVQLPIIQNALAGVLRLHLVGNVGTKVTIDDVALMPDAHIRPTHDWMPIVNLPSTWRPESLLNLRDQWRTHQPATLLKDSILAPFAAAWGHHALQSVLPYVLIIFNAILCLWLAWCVFKPSQSPDQQSARIKTPVILSASCFISSLLLFTEPTSRGLLGHMVLLITAAVMLLGALVPPQANWFGTKQAWVDAFKVTVWPLLGLLLIGLLWGWNHDSLGTRAFDPGRLFRYPIWSTVQQIILVGGFTLWAKHKPWSKHNKALIVALLFALMHSPNFTLMMMTLLIGYAWAKHAQKHEAILPLAASHAVLGTAVVLCVPTALLRSAEIGARFLL